MQKSLPDITDHYYRTLPDRHRRASRRRFFKGPFWMYSRYTLLVIWSGIKFFFTRDPQKAVALQARRVMRIAERQGAHFTIEGLDFFPAHEGPYVFACNHMSVLEVNVLPGLIASRIPMTFVVKKGLLKVPFFGRVLKSLEVIALSRKYPGEDLMHVLTEGKKLLAKGVSIILFPEGTRQKVFKPENFNSLAIKLALNAGASVVPVALKTDFWGVGSVIKEFGPLYPEKPVHISFAPALKPMGRGKEEHKATLEFISQKMALWNALDRI